MSDKFGMPEIDCRPAFEVITELREQLAAMTAERDEYRKALEICETEMQGDKWDALYIDTVLRAKYPREDAIEQARRIV